MNFAGEFDAGQVRRNSGCTDIERSINRVSGLMKGQAAGRPGGAGPEIANIRKTESVPDLDHARYGYRTSRLEKDTTAL
jgi:hypothetical protein